MLESYKEKVIKFKSEKVESKLVTSSQVKLKLSKKGGSKLSSMEGSSQVGVVQDKLVKECKLNNSEKSVINKLSQESANNIGMGLVCSSSSREVNSHISNESSSLEVKVKLFERINASGLPNFVMCRIPIPDSSLIISVWREKLQDYHDKVICEFLQFGFPLDFNRSTELNYDDVRNHKGARDYPQFIDGYLQKETECNRIVGPFDLNPLSVPIKVSPMNTVPKPNSEERRVIADLSWPLGALVNSGISKDTYLDETFDLHYTGVDEICNLVLSIGQGAVIYKRDLRHAYRQFPVDPRDYQYLGYSWKGKIYFDSVLAMGQRNAAMACSRSTEAVMFIHEKKGYRGRSYLDDLIGVEHIEHGKVAYEALGQLLEELGLLENYAKACPPSTVQIVLGVRIDTIAMTISISSERLVEIKELVRKWLKKSKSNKVELQSLVGKLCFVTKCVRQSKVFLNRVLELLRSFTSNQSTITLTDSFKKDIRWWFRFVSEFNGVSFIPAPNWNEPDVTFATDSCLSSCGGHCFNEYFHVSFPQFILEKDLPIHCLELLAVLIGVRCWGRICEGLKLQIYCDNSAAVEVINSSRTRDSFMASCIRELWLQVSKHNFQLRAVHLPGEENRVADFLSRWDLHPRYQVAFNEFVGNEQYFEIEIGDDMFKFSGDL